MSVPRHPDREDLDSLGNGEVRTGSKLRNLRYQPPEIDAPPLTSPTAVPDAASAGSFTVPTAALRFPVAANKPAPPSVARKPSLEGRLHAARNAGLEEVRGYHPAGRSDSGASISSTGSGDSHRSSNTDGSEYTTVRRTLSNGADANSENPPPASPASSYSPASTPPLSSPSASVPPVPTSQPPVVPTLRAVPTPISSLTTRPPLLSSSSRPDSEAKSANSNVSSSESVSLSTKRDAREAYFRGGGTATTDIKGRIPTTIENRVTDNRITKPATDTSMSAAKFDANLRERPPAVDKDAFKDTILGGVGKDVGKDSKPGAKSASAGGGGQNKELEGYVGFVNLPNQVYRKAVKRGFEFTLMVVGESGLGKSTLINSMFLTELYSADHPGPSLRIKKTVNVESTQVLLKEVGVQLMLTVVDTPGFGDAVDNSNCWQPVIDHIEAQYDGFLNSESRVNRTVSADTRVHCCLYYVSPNGHGLKPLDVEFMKRLHDKVNIIPIIAKADTLTVDECREFKKTILNEIAQHKIKIYEFPDCDEDEESKDQKKLKDRVPFAVVGSNTVVESGAAGRRVRGRLYPWGVVEVENLEHNDFIALRNMLIRTHMQDLKDVTNNVHYENFRYNKLASVTASSKGAKPGNSSNLNAPEEGPARDNMSPLVQMEEERKEHLSKMKKMEAEMEQVFEMKVKEKKQKLKDSEQDLVRRAEQMKKSLDQQRRELEEKRRAFESERTMWLEEEEGRKRSLEKQETDKNKSKKKTGLFQ